MIGTGSKTYENVLCEYNGK